MRPSFHPELRTLLRQHQHGKTVAQLAELTNRRENAIRRALEVMPDAYVLDWIQTRTKPPIAVWSVVVPPENAPKPHAKSRRTKRSVDVS